MRFSFFSKIKIPKPKLNLSGSRQGKVLNSKPFYFTLIILISFLFGAAGGILTAGYFYSQTKDYLRQFDLRFPEKIIEKPVAPAEETAAEKPVVSAQEYLPQTTQEEKIITAAREVSPAVVSIVITRYIEQLYLTPFEEAPPEKRIEEREVGGGTGFIISQDGMILTNKHVVLDEKADYTVLTNDGRKFPAEVLARDPIQDLAVLKIEGTGFPVVELGDSEKLQIGQTVIAIGNVLGEFQNTVSVGVISGLGRTITAYGGGLYQTLEDVIQTDAAINRGNSGGPLLNLKGEVIGINAAMVVGGENIGFAIPINKAKRSIEQVKTLGRIVYPFLGVRYVLINEEIQRENDLPVDYGVWVISGDQGEPAIFPDSAAEKAGLREGDIILEFNREKITPENTLARIIVKYDLGDKIVLRILRDNREMSVEATLGEHSG